ncbi:uncharacterized protein L201_006452 [Kwoniella dendrophila CBS 6074]|uniref:Uncharacterized protein n=1 Tax=Kwoniella dendrophila CBS 6074 TaxID=1295534 RepID=A0AAX4K1Q5_9TREE
MASLLLGFPNSLPTGPDDVEGKKKKIPKVAVYVAGAAFAITTGLTILVIPYVRQAAKMMNTTQFLSHQSQALLDARMKMSKKVTASSSITTTTTSTTSLPINAVASSSNATTLQPSPSLASISAIPNTPPTDEEIDPVVKAARDFNAREEKSLYGSSLAFEQGEEGGSGPASGLLGFYALGIATALVWGTAGLGALITAKIMGVKDMEEFSTKMRETLNLSMPTLIQSVNQPGRSIDGFDGEAIDQWVAKLEKDDEEAEAEKEKEKENQGKPS